MTWGRSRLQKDGCGVIKVDDLYAFLGTTFDYILVVDTDERAIQASSLFRRECLPPVSPPGTSADRQMDGLTLEDILTPASLKSFRSAMALTQAGSRAVALCTPKSTPTLSIPLRIGQATAGDGSAYIFFGTKVVHTGTPEHSERDERVKELACLYRVLEWIEVSESVDDFFTSLPRYLKEGMLYPDDAMVFSTYQGVEYGWRPSESNHISVRLVVGNKVKGDIQVGYLDDKHELLPDEQKMLDEIGRALNVALERKEYRQRLALKQDEEADFNKRLAELSTVIETRTKELEEQKNKLAVASSYLDRVNKGWEQTRDRLETMFKAIPDDVVLIDKHRKVVMTNREGITPGTYCFQSIFGRDHPCDDCRLARILKDKTPLIMAMQHGDRYLQVHALPVHRDEEVDGILEFYRDVTLEKTYDQQLQQADKLASLGQLVSGIGHEINNPNQFIRGNIKIVKQAIEDMLPIVDQYYASHHDLKIAKLNYEFLREHLMTLVNDMAHGSERIKTIVEGLRTFARKDEGLLVDKVDINTLIEAASRLVHQEVNKRADVKLELAEGVPTFTGNSQKIEQVLINLMVNASQAMPDDRRGLVTLTTSFNDTQVVIEVRDNGQGMSEKVLKQIFDPFFTTKRAKGGTGLGLAISYKIIEEHGGNISVTSKPGVGTAFTVRIPIAQPQAAPGPARVK